MKLLHFAVLAAWSLAAAGSALAQCPPTALGVEERVSTERTGAKEWVSTAAFEAFGEEDEFIASATQDALLLARVYLRKDPRVPKTERGRLIGVEDAGVCRIGLRVYATVSVNAEKVALALRLQRELRGAR
jgi:hypothetical protein